ncbi:helix-turn-helix transcriptional regulator [Microbacterium indicum]|uniref:helix-turn-helix transcriptional regulator n=1 Tax=Microbacterium indicum TaxID=358100 RepID=UPI000410B5E6|nr:WYL domain-containing protein [Microbacterium indicum]
MARIPAEERLLNLTVALLGTDVGLSRAQIFQSVSGYAEHAGTEARERMFERDKETLVGLGTRIEVIGDPENPQNQRDARYRIPRDDNALPVDLEFTPAELALLSLAADAWGEATMSREARAGVRKIRALGLDVDEPVLGFTPRLTAREPAFAPLEAAIDRAAVVRFDYLRPGSANVRARTVRPLALVQFEGRWHLHAHDTHFDEARTFLLVRIVSPVVETGERFDPALRVGAGERAIAGLRDVASRNRALIEATPGSEAALRLARRAVPGAEGRGTAVAYIDQHVLADEIASYGPDARVVEPESLRELVVLRLAEAERVHTGAPDPAPADAPEPRRRRRSPVAAAERVRTYLTLVPWLLERGEATVAEAAAEFEVAPSDMRRMVETLTLVGAPDLDAYTGDMFDIDWDALDADGVIRLTRSVGIERVQRFTSREAAALAAGLQLIAAAPGVADDSLVRGLRDKLARGSGSEPAEVVVADGPADPTRSALARAVRDGRAVRFSYTRPGGEATARTVDPWGLLFAGGEWYLQGWCHLRRAPRTFLIERMSALSVTDEVVQHSGRAAAGLFATGTGDVTVELRFPAVMLPVIAGYLEHAEIREIPGFVLARIAVGDVGVVKSLAARGGGRVEVLGPPAARDAARAWARAGRDLYPQG